MARSTGTADVDDTVSRLRRAARRLEQAREAIADVGASSVSDAVDAVDTAADLFGRYEESATGSGREEFQQYLEFQERFAAFVESLPDDLPGRDGFEAADERFQKRRLSESDFDAARDDLSQTREVAELEAERTAAREALEEARHDARKRLSTVEETVSELERLHGFERVDLSADTGTLRDPIEAYNDAVREAFTDFRGSASARDVLAWAETAAGYPLVDYPRPPADLLDYVQSYEAGTETADTLLDYVDESRSKLDHLVADAAELKTRVAVHRTYLSRLDAEPLTVSWPPPTRERLRHRASELVSVVGRFAPEETVARCRTVRDRSRHEAYDRLRRVAVASESLDDAERRRVRAGVGDDLDRAREARDRLREALSETDLID